MRFSIVLCLCLAMASLLQAQELAYGFKAGLNFSNFTGGVNEAAETNAYTNGFHIGLLVDLGFTDNFGLRGELLYAQKGREYQYDGDSYFIVSPFDLRIATRGTRTTNLSVSNSYVQLPVMGYAKFGRIEFMGGLYGSIRIGSLGNGSMTYQSDAIGIEPRAFNLLHVYTRDKGGTFGGTIETTFINGNRVEIPSELGAYYEFPEGQPDKGLYTLGDLGLVGGASFYLGRTLFFNVRAEYGLVDVTNNDADVSIESLNSNGQFIFRTDDDRNFTIHTALGFRF